MDGAVNAGPLHADNAKPHPAPDHPRRLNLALQGGGSHGAFTWGVLDRLLEDGRFAIDGVSGTSAGAMNAVCLADGFHSGGNEGARQRLRQFWQAVGNRGRVYPSLRSPFELWHGKWPFSGAPMHRFQNFLRHHYSPYDLNPFDVNPLKEVAEEVIRFENVQACDSLKLFIAATNVRNGKVRVFTNAEIGIDELMASACLPTVFKAVEIDGVPYWDGGYMGNPVLFPFFYETRTEDLLLVQINPVERMETPRTAQEILNRIDEITFNASLLREFRAIELIKRLIAQGKLSRDEYLDVRVHRIEAPHELVTLSAATKMNAEPQFLQHLFDLGQDSASAWLENASDKVSREPGIDLVSEIDRQWQRDRQPENRKRPRRHGDTEAGRAKIASSASHAVFTGGKRGAVVGDGQPWHRRGMKLASPRAAVSALFLANGIVAGCWSVFVPAIQRNLAIGEQAMGILILIGASAGFVGLMLAGPLIARVGSRMVATIAGLGLAPGLLLLSQADAYAVAVGLFVLLFVAMSVMDVAMNANGSDVERKRAKAIMSSFHGFWSLGAMLGAGSGGFLLANLGQAGFAWSALVACALLTLWAWPRLVRHEIDAAPSGSPTAKRRLRLPGNAKVYLFGLLALAAFTAEGSVIDWSAIYLRKELAADVEWSGFAFAGFSLAMMIARFSGDLLRNRFGGVRLLQVSAVLALAGFLAAGSGNSLELAVVGFLCAGFGCANIVPVAFSGAANVAGVKPATGIAIATTCGYFGLLTAPAMLGAVGERVGFGPVYVGFAVAMAGVLLLAPVARASAAGAVPTESAV